MGLSGGTTGLCLGTLALVLAASPLAASGRAGEPTFVSPQPRLVTANAAQDDSLGTSVAIANGVALLGAYLEDDPAGANAGAVYAFARRGSSWTEEARLAPSIPSANAGFGFSVSADGGTAVVGAPFEDSSAGKARVFVRTGTSWSEQALLTPLDATSPDEAGWSVSISSDTVVVGAHNDAHSGSAFAGSAYVFVRDGSTWTQQAKLTASDFAPLRFFGSAVAIDADTIVVGSGEADGSGSAYVFVRAGTSWSEQAKLTASDAAAFDGFGMSSVSIEGEVALVGSALDDNAGGRNAGAAYVFARAGTAWSETAKLTASGGGRGAFLGRSTALSQGRAVVGAQGAEVAYLFAPGPDGWSETAVLAPAAPADDFGRGLAFDGTTAVVGAPGDDGGAASSGSGYPYRFAVSAAFCDGLDGSLAACPCGNAGSADAGCDVQQGTGGVRLTVVAQDTTPPCSATLRGDGFPTAFTPTAIVLRGRDLEPGAVPFGDGVRCVSTPVARLGVTNAGNGAAIHTFGHSTMVGAGTFFYQEWFRNTPTMFCTASAFNLSSGRALSW